MIFHFAPGTYRILHRGFVEVETQKLTADLLIDTGCTRTTFRREYLQNIGAIKADVSPILITTGSGAINADSYVLYDLTAFGHNTGPITVLGIDMPREIEQDGMIGMDFLAILKMTIDFPKGTIRILKPTKPRTQRK